MAASNVVVIAVSIAIRLVSATAFAADLSTPRERLRHNLAVVEARVKTKEVEGTDPAVVLLRRLAAIENVAPDVVRGETRNAIATASVAPFLNASWAAEPLRRVLATLVDDADFANAVETIAFLAASDVVDRVPLAAAESRIGRERQSEAQVRVVDASGGPAAGVRVHVREIRGDVRFGGNFYLFRKARSEALNRAYEERFAELFDLATTDLYWVDYEIEKGKPDYARTAAVVAWCKERDIAVKGHPILWWHQSGRPRWDAKPPREVELARVRALVERFRGGMSAWEVVNEPAHTGEPVDDAFRAAREIDAAASLLINDFQVFHDGFPAYRDLVAGMIARGVPFDGVGIQGHYPLSSRFPLRDVARHLASFATLGKALHITELTPPSAGQEMVGSELLGVWNEATQAEYAAKLYAVCLAEPAVASIVWWDLSDQKSWQPGGGLLRDDMSEKPAYVALRALLRERWRTTTTGITDARGNFPFRGYHGAYAVEVEGAEPARLEVRRGGLNLAIVRRK